MRYVMNSEDRKRPRTSNANTPLAALEIYPRLQVVPQHGGGDGRSLLVLVFLLLSSATSSLLRRFWKHFLCCIHCRFQYRSILHGCVMCCSWSASSLRLAASNGLLSSFSGNTAMCRPIRPRLPISRPTSAARSVLNFKTTPDSGSNVFNVSVARGTRGVDAASLSSASAASRLLLFGCAYLVESRFGMLYFVVIRV